MDHVYLILDPYHPYPIEFIHRTAKRNPQIKPIAIFTNKRMRFHLRKYLKSINEHIFHEVFDLDGRDIDLFSLFLKSKYDIQGILPWSEQVMDESIQLLQNLDLGWNDLEVLKRFRNKHSLKNFLRQNHPEIFINQIFKVRDFEQFERERDHLPERYIIKPNQGYGNQRIGFFSKNTSNSELRKYFESSHKFNSYIVEEFLNGEEYAVNGQMDDQGHALIFSIFHYERKEANGCPNVYYATWNLPSIHPKFKIIESYAKSIMKATGLRRCPFHLEIIDDKTHGPTLVEAAARPGGGFLMYATNDVHNQSLDCFDIAAHYYLSDRSYGPIQYHWEYGNNIHFLDLDGISGQKGYVYSLPRKKEVEQMPEFVRWTTEPFIGQKLFITKDLETLPWALHLKTDLGEDHLRKVSHEIRLHLDFQRDSSSPITKAMIRGKAFFERISEKTLWWVSVLKSKIAEKTP